MVTVTSSEGFVVIFSIDSNVFLVYVLTFCAMLNMVETLPVLLVSNCEAAAPLLSVVLF